MYGGLRAKFTQNPMLFEQLRGTGQALLAEASTTNLYWSSGVDRKNVTSLKEPHQWRGENKLGYLLMDLRDELNASMFWGKIDNKRICYYFDIIVCECLCGCLNKFWLVIYFFKTSLFYSQKLLLIFSFFSIMFVSHRNIMSSSSTSSSPSMQLLSSLTSTSITCKKDEQSQLQEEEEEELLLRENPQRFVLFPVKHMDLWAYYKKAMASFWTVSEVV